MQTEAEVDVDDYHQADTGSTVQKNKNEIIPIVPCESSPKFIEPADSIKLFEGKKSPNSNIFLPFHTLCF